MDETIKRRIMEKNTLEKGIKTPTTTKDIPVNISTSTTLLGIEARQCLHFPPSTKYENMGIRS